MHYVEEQAKDNEPAHTEIAETVVGVEALVVSETESQSERITHEHKADGSSIDSVEKFKKDDVKDSDINASQSNEAATIFKNCAEENMTIGGDESPHYGYDDVSHKDESQNDPSSLMDQLATSLDVRTASEEGLLPANADEEENELSETERVSPYLLVNRNLDVSTYESVGLLYASSPKAKDNRLVVCIFS